MDGYADIRCDEDYERFYRAHAGSGTKLPPPLASASVYNQLQQRRQAAMATAGQTANRRAGCFAPAGACRGGSRRPWRPPGQVRHLPDETDCLDGKARRNPFGLPACVSCIGTAKTRITSAHLPAGEAQMAVLPELALAPGVSRPLQVQRRLLGSSTPDRNLR